MFAPTVKPNLFTMDNECKNMIKVSLIPFLKTTSLCSDKNVVTMLFVMLHVCRENAYVFFMFFF